MEEERSVRRRPSSSSETLKKYLQEIAKLPRVTPDEEKTLGDRIQHGDKVALRTLVEANLRFAGPETMETRIFGRLTAWQNWIFQRPNAVGETGALQRYGTGVRGDYDMRRV